MWSSMWSLFLGEGRKYRRKMLAYVLLHLGPGLNHSFCCFIWRPWRQCWCLPSFFNVVVVVVAAVVVVVAGGGGGGQDTVDDYDLLLTARGPATLRKLHLPQGDPGQLERQFHHQKCQGPSWTSRWSPRSQHSLDSTFYSVDSRNKMRAVLKWHTFFMKENGGKTTPTMDLTWWLASKIDNTKYPKLKRRYKPQRDPKRMWWVLTCKFKTTHLARHGAKAPVRRIGIDLKRDQNIEQKNLKACETNMAMARIITHC